MDNSILNTIKKILGVAADYTAFDLDIIIHINAVFATLHQLGIGPVEGFMIEDATTTWDAFLVDDPTMLNPVKAYVYLRVRLLFDPPGTSFLIESINKQIEQLEWRLNVRREEVTWVPPTESLPISE